METGRIALGRAAPVAAVKGAKHPRLFYGWYIVGVAFLAQLMSWGLMFYALTFFVEPMTRDLGWTVTQFALVYTINSVLWGFAVPLFGGYVDRHGIRSLMVIGSLGTGAGLIAVAYVQDLLFFYLVLGVFVTIGMVMMAGLSSVAIANWFVEKRGRTLAIMSMGSSVAGLTLSPLAALLIETHGWRIVWIVFGIIVIVTVTLPAFFLIKRRPEDVGLYPDGKDHPPDRPTAGRVLERKVLWTRRQAVRTPTFWLLIAGFALNYLGVGALLIYLAPFLGTKGLTGSQTAFGVFLFALGALLVKPVAGILLERFPPRYVAAGSVLLSALGLFLMIVLQGPLLYAALVLYALSFGGSYPMEEMLWASSFGRWTLGQVRSLAFPFTVALGSAGPVVGGIAFDLTGSFSGAFWIFILAYLISAGALALARPPRAPIVIEPPAPVVPVVTGWRTRFSTALQVQEGRAFLPAVAAVLLLAVVLSYNLIAPGGLRVRRGDH